MFLSSYFKICHILNLISNSLEEISDLIRIKLTPLGYLVQIKIMLQHTKRNLNSENLIMYTNCYYMIIFWKEITTRSVKCYEKLSVCVLEKIDTQKILCILFLVYNLIIIIYKISQWGFKFIVRPWKDPCLYTYLKYLISLITIWSQL